MKKEVVVFTKTVDPGEQSSISERIKDYGTVEQVYVRFYPGQTRDFEIRPVIKHKQGEMIQDLVSYAAGGNGFLCGDDDKLTFPVTIPVDNDDEIVIFFNNTSAYPYSLMVLVTIDYYGGKSRVIGGVVNG